MFVIYLLNKDNKINKVIKKMKKHNKFMRMLRKHSMRSPKIKNALMDCEKY